MPINDENEKKKRLLEIVRQALERDSALRETHKIGDKFRFIRERLQSLYSRLEKLAIQQQIEEKNAQVAPSEDEVSVFVYLFNAHGLQIKSWQNMMSQQVFYEYSINRPVYAERSQIEELIRTKKEKNQHGYLEFAIKKSDIIKPIGESSPKDVIGNPLLKVREGAFRLEKMVCFTHNNILYVLDSDKKLIVKPTDV